MFNLDEEIEKVKRMFDSGQIDEATYNREINILTEKIEEEKENNTKNTFRFLKNSYKLFVIVFVAFILIWIIYEKNPTKKIEYVNSLNNIKGPTQILTNGNVIKNFNDWDVQINYVAKYIVTGRVVDVQNYFGYTFANKLSPKDVGMSWGALAREENNKKVTWTSPGTRFLYRHYDDMLWFEKMGGESKINECCSNNHLIPSDRKTRKLINLINVGDYIRIEGYLVNVFAQKSNGAYFTWNTSTTRSDTGNGACEIIYVTNVTWLKEKK